MIRLGIVSDSHGCLSMIEKAAVALSDCDQVIHLGDVVSDAERLARRLPCPVHCVRGNCDSYSSGAPEQMTLKVSGHTLLLTHGNTYRVKQGLLMLAYGAREVGADIVLYGHTHIPSVDRDGPLLLINPGALMDGRCAILTFSDNGPVPAMKIL